MSVQAQETDRRHLMPLLAAAASVLSTAPAYADLGDQLAKLLPNDGEAGDSFGNPVALSPDFIGTAIVGARGDAWGILIARLFAEARSHGLHVSVLSERRSLRREEAVGGGLGSLRRPIDLSSPTLLASLLSQLLQGRIQEVRLLWNEVEVATRDRR
ncbi:MAG: FG-GAP repeat protein [Phycisphaerae bacterium]